jgi:hypothetical protein
MYSTGAQLAFWGGRCFTFLGAATGRLMDINVLGAVRYVTEGC